jgi:starch-binding outer membrane protein, SusD/RagB family
MRTTTTFLAVLGSILAGTGCYDYNITNPNAPTASSVYGNPTRANLSALATGMFDQSRNNITQFIWRLGSMGREGANLAGNNQPDYIEPYLGPLSTTQFGGSLWAAPYVQILNTNQFIDAVPKSPDLSDQDKAASIGFAETLKALAFLYVVQTRGQLGAPVDVDRPPTAPPAPFVTEDSVYRTILFLLNDARAHLATAGGAFPFPLPPGYGLASTPQTFRGFTWMLTAKANILRATDHTQCGGAPTSCDQAALAAIDSSGFLSIDPGNFFNGVNFDFGTGPGDSQNDLADPVTSAVYYALTLNITDAQTQASSAPDQRVLDKITGPNGVTPQTLSGFPLNGTLKFTNYFTGGVADASHPIPIIRDEELILLKAEAEIGLGQLAAATTDLNVVRQGSGKLAPLTPGLSQAALIDELLYNRRYSLLWEQGTRWIDARRYGRLSSIEPAVAGGNVPSIMPVPSDECQARGLGSSCTPPTSGS